VVASIGIFTRKKINAVCFVYNDIWGFILFRLWYWFVYSLVHWRKEMTSDNLLITCVSNTYFRSIQFSYNVLVIS